MLVWALAIALHVARPSTTEATRYRRALGARFRVRCDSDSPSSVLRGCYWACPSQLLIFQKHLAARALHPLSDRQCRAAGRLHKAMFMMLGQNYWRSRTEHGLQ